MTEFNWEKNDKGLFLERNRAELVVFHPLVTREILLPTSPIDELFRIVRRTVLLREQGCLLSGYSGVGKTSALAMVQNMMHEQLPNLKIISHITYNQTHPTLRSFLKHFLETLNHPERKGETPDLRTRVGRFISDEARISGMNMVLMLIDEAQSMELDDFYFLKDIDNSLVKNGIQLITVTMGQAPDMDAVINMLHSGGHLDLISRFAMDPRLFRAFDCESDVEQIFSHIDDSIYPQNSGITWTEFFFPIAFSNGFRIKTQTGEFIDAVRNVAPYGIKEGFDYPARQTFSAIRAFLFDNARYDAKNMTLPNSAWPDAIATAKLAEAMRLMNPGGTVEGTSIVV